MPITNASAVWRWIGYGAVRFLAGFACLVWGPDLPSIDKPTASMTMAFAVMAFSAILGGLVLRRDPASGLMPPVLKALAILAIPAVIVVLSTELPFMQRRLMTEPLSGSQWLVVLGLSVAAALVPEVDKWIRRRRMPKAGSTDVHAAVDPSRARPVAAGG